MFRRMRGIDLPVQDLLLEGLVPCVIDPVVEDPVPHIVHVAVDPAVEDLEGALPVVQVMFFIHDHFVWIQIVAFCYRLHLKDMIPVVFQGFKDRRIR